MQSAAFVLIGVWVMFLRESLYIKLNIKLNFSLQIPRFLSSISRIFQFMSNQRIRACYTNSSFNYTMYVT